METVTVQGVDVPSIGLGTWQVEGDEATEAVRHALEIGYRHVDGARQYGNEEQVGRGLAASGVERDEYFLTSKIGNDEHQRVTLKAAAEDTLRALRTDYLDLLLLHWPNQEVSLEESLEALASLRDEEKIRHLGVSNFPPGLLHQAVQLAPVFCIQVEYHPFLAQPDLLEIANEHDLLLTAYSPIARGEVLDDPVLREIGEAHGKSPVQVALRWLIDQPQVAAIPRSTSAENRAANLDVFDFELTDGDRDRIDGLARGQRLIDPPFAPDWDS